MTKLQFCLFDLFYDVTKFGNNWTHRVILSAPSSPVDRFDKEYYKTLDYLKRYYRGKEIDLRDDCVNKNLALEFSVGDINID